MTCFIGQDILLACNEIKGVYLRDICFDFFAIGSNILDRSSSHASGNTAEIFESTHTIEECSLDKGFSFFASTDRDKAMCICDFINYHSHDFILDDNTCIAGLRKEEI